MRKILPLLIASFCIGHLFAQDSVWIARTKGKLPFLEYGIGDDRLGGAKMGYLDSNIVLRVEDSFATDYKVRLSALHSAYIAKESLVLEGKANRKAEAHNTNLSGNCKVFGDELSDYVILSLPAAMPYRSFQLVNPSRIVVDVFGVTSNTNWITQLKSAREIRNTWYEMVEDDVFRIYIELKHAQPWGHSIYYDSTGRKLTIRIKRQPTVLDIRRMKIAIDPGHGGDNSGASGLNSGILEKQYTLVLARELEKTLRKAGVQKIFMTRTKDTSLSMLERITMLRQYDPDLLVSIHLNSAGSDTVQGVSTFYRYIGFRPLSTAILNQMLTLGLKEYGNIGNFNFALNGPTDYPNALVEVAFLSNPQDEKKILSVRFQKAVGQKIYLGILDWLKASK